MKWLELKALIDERVGNGTFFGEEDVTVYCAGSGEYYPVDDVCVAGDDDNVVSPEALVIVIQN